MHHRFYSCDPIVLKSCYGWVFACVCVFWLRMACRHPSVLGGKVSAAFPARSVPSPESAGSSGNGVSDSGAIRR